MIKNQNMNTFINKENNGVACHGWWITLDVLNSQVLKESE